MHSNLIILIVEAMAVYFLVLLAHSLRNRFGLYHFYALIGGVTAVMSWITDAGVRVEAFGISFMVGSTVFYTALLLSVFVIYVFDGPRATRIAISTIIAVSILVPVISVILNTQMSLSDTAPLAKIPMPSLRINAASVITTAVDLIFLAVTWEFLGSNKFNIKLWLRAYLTLLGVMMIDVVLFNTGAFYGEIFYADVLQGTLVTRFIVSLFAFPFLLIYIYWQSSINELESEARPVFSILKQVAEIKQELKIAQEELAKQKQVENAIRLSLEKHRALTEELGNENKMKELLLDIITHDLKNPAGVIKGIAGLLMEEYPKDSMVEMVDESVANLIAVIDNATTLSMMAGGEEIEKSKLNISELLKGAVKEYELSFTKNDIEIYSEIEDDLFINANPIISEIFKNYLSNALKYADNSAKLVITSKLVESKIQIEFADFGNTIPLENREKIFERSFQQEKNKYPGRGLGLAIAKRIAKTHNAEIGVKPNFPKGNIFYFCIDKYEDALINN